MPKYRVHIGYGFVGCEIDDVIEADTQEDAEQIAGEMAMQQVEYSVEEIKDSDEEDEK